MRIISGKLRARRFSLPKAFPSRPTTDYAKEGLFNMLQNRIDLVDLDILDLCAGTGNISFEFASRDSGRITAVDQNYNAIQFIKKTSKDFGIDDTIEVHKNEIIQFLNKTDKTFDLIFADPPYDWKQHHEIAEIVFERKLLKPDGILIIEHGKHTSLEHLPNYDFMRIFGKVHFSFFEINEDL